ncbi:MAG: hypothetical protein JNM00_05500, partial [Flavobacteriales bacterium]|nr:hypothetical protein [Flavobacteriales bacterium]
YTASEFNNNLFWAGLSAPTLTISGNGNVFGADPLSFFETGVAVGDQQWQVPDTSPANGVADDGTQVGMFGGADPYVLSGLDLPVLSFGSVPPCFIVEQPGCVTFTFFSPDGIPMSNGEYIFDSDPGPGSGIDFGLTSAAGTVCFAISTVDLSTGFHRIAYRIRQSDGRWGHSREATFQVKPDDVLPVVSEIEYFFDEDPAFGLASPETNPLDGPLSEIVFTIPLSFLSVGPHNLWLRTKDENGNYSTTLSRTFLVLPDEPPLPPITQVEFVLDDDNGYGSGTGFAATGVNWESEYTIDLTDVPLGFHKLYVRERDVNGDFSTTQEKEIFVTIPGDLTQDFCVNVSDLIVFLGLFTCSAPEGYYCEGDFAYTPGFSLVNVNDLLLFMSYYGSGNCTGEVDVN